MAGSSVELVNQDFCFGIFHFLPACSQTQSCCHDVAGPCLEQTVPSQGVNQHHDLDCPRDFSETTASPLPVPDIHEPRWAQILLIVTAP
jgi:hypothetical protein